MKDLEFGGFGLRVRLWFRVASGLWVFGSAEIRTALLGTCLWRQVCDKDLSVVEIGLHLIN